MSLLMYSYYLYGSILFMAEILAGEFMFSLKYRRKNKFGRRLFIACAASLPAVALVTFAYYAASQLQSEILTSAVVVLTYILMFVLSLVILALSYKETLPSVIVCGVAGYASQHLVYNVICILKEATGLYDFAFAGPWNNLAFNALQIGIYALFYCAIYFAIAGQANKNTPDGIVGKNVLLLSVITLTITLLFNGVRDLFVSESLGLYVLCCLFSIVCCVFILIVRAGIFEQSRLRREIETINRLLYDERRQFEISKENIELINIKCHDIRNQLELLGRSGKTPTDEELEELKNAISVYDAILKTGNDTLDIILTERSLYCEKHGIRLTCNVDGGKLAFMRASDIGSLFGNALTNAIEAVSVLTDKNKRVVSLVVREAVGQLSVLTENYYQGELVFENGLPLTTKEDKEYHGFGVKSIRLIVERYGGTLTFGAEDGVFRMMIMLPLPAA